MTEPFSKFISRLIATPPRYGLALCALAVLLLCFAGCYSNQHGVEVDVRPEFLLHDRVALWPTPMPRETEDFFIPLYMQAFPSQVLVERRDVAAIIGEQDILPERLDEETRAKLRRILGVKAILYPSITKDGFAMKVIDTETGAITASVFVDANDQHASAIPIQDLVRKAVVALHCRANREHLPVPRDPRTDFDTSEAPSPEQLTPVTPPPHD